MDLENPEDQEIFAFCSPADKAKVRKALKDDLKYVEAFSRSGYIGTVAGVNVYTTKRATDGKIIVATRDAVKLFLKDGTEVEQSSIFNRSAADANTRTNTVYTRKYFVAALVDDTKVVEMDLTA